MSENTNNIIDAFKKQVEQASNKVAIIEESQEYTYGQLWKEIHILSLGLRAMGVKYGDKVVVILPNSKNFITIFLSLLNIGAIMVPLYPGLTVREYKDMINASSPVIIFTNFYVFTKVLAYETSFLEKDQFVITENDEWIKTKYQNVMTLSDVISSGTSYDKQIVETSYNQIASINYTYRGFGIPLGSILTNENYYLNVQCLLNTECFQGEKYLSALPMAHIFSLVCYVLLPLLSGKTMVIIKSHAAWEFLKAVDEFKVDIIFGVPTFYSYLLKSFDKEKFDVSCVKCGICGGSFLSEIFHEELEKTFGIKVFQGYGLTEALIVSVNDQDRSKVPSLGQLLQGFEAKIFDDEGNEIKTPGQTGEIALKGPSVMSGYYNDEVSSDKVFHNGWLTTGDYGRLDEDGYLYFDGLKKRIAKVGGHIVDLKEVENVILTHPHVHTTEVYSEHNAFWGETVIAEIVTGMKTSEEEILTFCSSRLAVYKIPKKIKIMSRDSSQILVLDDDVECQCNYLFDLNQVGYNVNCVDAVFKAVEEIKTGLYDLLITELVLPDKQGEELLNKIKMVNPNFPIIIVTSHNDLLESLDLSDFNILTHAIKPILKDDLIEIVNNKS